MSWTCHGCGWGSRVAVCTTRVILKLRAVEQCLSLGLENLGNQSNGSQFLKLLQLLALAGDDLRATSGSKMMQTNLGAGLKPTAEQDH